jgi:predicted nucleotide-binding protein
MSEITDILDIADSLARTAKAAKMKQVYALIKVAEKVGRSWSGSWLGYHSRVYYKDLVPAPPGARFSVEWGLMHVLSSEETVGDWVEYPFEQVAAAIYEMAGNPDLSRLRSMARKTRDLFEEAQARLLSILSNVCPDLEGDKFLQDSVGAIKKQKVVSASDFVKHFTPSGQMVSRDMNAIQLGLRTPPHIAVFAEASSFLSPLTACEELSKLARRVAAHLDSAEKRRPGQQPIGTKVFIGHGRSAIWKDLKDFVQDRLGLPWDEFNRVPVAGVTNVARLSRMVDEAAFAFLIMTGEDEQPDGKLRARLNVVHEAGLFQGRLGFERAIVLLEEGCEEFSNISGLGQLRFPKGNIAAAFEEVRKVLEREGILHK